MGLQTFLNNDIRQLHIHFEHIKLMFLLTGY